MRKNIIVHQKKASFDFRVFYVAGDGTAFERVKRAKGRALVPYKVNLPVTEAPEILLIEHMA